MKIEPDTQERSSASEEWRPKHPADCDCSRCVNKTLGQVILACLTVGVAEFAEEEAVPTPRHGDPFEVECPAISILEDHGAALARQHLFA